MNRLRLPLIACCTWTLLASAAGAVEPKDTTATVAAWNIKAKPDPIPPERAKRIALGIEALDAEIIALSEVDPPETIPLLVSELKSLGADYASVLPPQVSELKLALLYKPGVTVSDVKMLDDINLGDPTIRKALSAKVKIGQFDFRLISVHLKSGSYPENMALRAKQTPLLNKHIRDGAAGDEKDVLLVGDYNMPPDRDAENYKLLNPEGFLKVISAEDLKNLGSHLFEGRYGNLLDGFAVTRHHTEREYIDGSLRIFPLNRALHYTLREYEDQVSDHLPLTARFRVTKDDD